MIRWLCAFAMLTAMACSCATSPTASDDWIVMGRYYIEAPPEYEEWYAQVEECLGQRGLFEAVQWYAASEIVSRFHTNFEGIPLAAHGIIVLPNTIVIRRRDLRRATTIRHESVHHILQDLSHDHPRFSICSELTY